METKASKLKNQLNEIQEQKEKLDKQVLQYIRNYICQYGETHPTPVIDFGESYRAKTICKLGYENTLTLNPDNTIVHSSMGKIDTKVPTLLMKVFNEINRELDSHLDIMDDSNGHDYELVKQINDLYAKYPNSVHRILKFLYIHFRDEAMDLNLGEDDDSDFDFEMLQHICNDDDLVFIINSMNYALTESTKL